MFVETIQKLRPCGTLTTNRIRKIGFLISRNHDERRFAPSLGSNRIGTFAGKLSAISDFMKSP
jgi:hypothetical protein